MLCPLLLCHLCDQREGCYGPRNPRRLKYLVSILLENCQLKSMPVIDYPGNAPNSDVLHIGTSPSQMGIISSILSVPLSPSAYPYLPQPTPISLSLSLSPSAYPYLPQPTPYLPQATPPSAYLNLPQPPPHLSVHSLWYPPKLRHTTSASFLPNRSSQMVPQALLTQSSTLPSLVLGVRVLLANLTEPV